MKFVITIEVPDGSSVQVNGNANGDYPQGTNVSAVVSREPVASWVPPFADELIPLPDAIPIPGDPVPFRGAAQNPPPGCPVHRVAWKVVPAGVSKKTGKPYDSFRVCSVQGCEQRPAA